MPLTDAQVKGLKPDRKTNLSDGLGLCLVVQPNKSGDGHLRYFVGRTRHQGKQVEVRIGPYGKAEGAYSLKEARQRWAELRLWAKEHGQDPRQWKRQAKREQQQEAPTIEAMAEKWLKTVSNEQTRGDYANKLHHQILPLLGAERPITDFSWDNARREVLAVLESYKARGRAVSANRAMQLMRAVFAMAIDEGWLKEPNAALKSPQQPKPRSKPHPSLQAEELPLLFQRLEEHGDHDCPVVTLGLKLTILTFLRASAVVSLRWEHIDEEAGLWTIPGSTKGLKRGEGRHDLDHVVPLTPAINAVLGRLRQMNGNYDWAFYSQRGGQFPHINPSSLNKRLKDMGYGGMLTAHGLRRTAGTIVVEKLGFPWELWSRQAGHLYLESTSKSSKLRQSYDGSQFIEERRAMLEAWNQWCSDQGLRYVQ
jgi:integrase